ncbi:NmrA family NAD(P)-binding protein [Nocardia sp. NPDC088792]|uniref:NmrA family NAD(P)-binding protein n=1 Tax=Nocardia sp. NPDC088792 TaxID=3364332 RepID=UPI0038088DE5
MATSTTRSNQRTLVLGATGRHGRTGARLVERLLAHGHLVRVLARGEGPGVEELRQRGVEVVIGDLLDRRSLSGAVDEVDAVYFAYPIAPGVVSAAANLASVLRAVTPSPRLVVMSMAVSAADSPSGLGRAQWSAEEIFTWAGLEPTVLRVAALFYENILVLHGQSIRATRGFANSFGASQAPWMSGHDAADLAATALIHPDRFAGGTVAYPPAAELLSHTDIAGIISAEIGHDVRYTPISQQQWQDELTNSSGSVINPDMAQHISTIGARMATSTTGLPVAPDSHALAELIGHPPMPFTEFVREHRSEFQPH